MRNPSTYSLNNEELGLDAYSTSDPASTQAYLEDSNSPQNSYTKEQSDDSDNFSDSSKKIRKKRNAYSKISDEIRCKLLDCVKNGETLKSAAKRFKINYSSAKSILHTFRKEGRILKKSAQERTIKRKPESMFDFEQTPKSGRMMKKNSIHIEKDQISKSLTSLAVRGVYSRESTPAGSLSRLDEGAYDHQHHQYAHGGMEQEANAQGRKISYHHDDQHYNNANYYRTYNDGLVHHQQPQQQQHHEVARNYMLNEGLDHQGNYGMQYSREYDSFNDMVNALQHRPGHADEFFTDSSANYLQQREFTAPQMEDKFYKNEHGGDYHEQHDGSFNPLKSFMDTQSMFRDALKKATHVSYSNSNNTGFRKSSIDLF